MFNVGVIQVLASSSSTWNVHELRARAPLSHTLTTIHSFTLSAFHIHHQSSCQGHIIVSSSCQDHIIVSSSCQDHTIISHSQHLSYLQQTIITPRWHRSSNHSLTRTPPNHSLVQSRKLYLPHIHTYTSSHSKTSCEFTHIHTHHDATSSWSNQR